MIALGETLTPEQMAFIIRETTGIVFALLEECESFFRRQFFCVCEARTLEASYTATQLEQQEFNLDVCRISPG